MEITTSQERQESVNSRPSCTESEDDTDVGDEDETVKQHSPVCPRTSDTGGGGCRALSHVRLPLSKNIKATLSAGHGGSPL
jgi:hypothetical protein